MGHVRVHGEAVQRITDFLTAPGDGPSRYVDVL